MCVCVCARASLHGHLCLTSVDQLAVACVDSLIVCAVKKRELYIPPAPPEDEETLFATMAVGINFEKYDEIPVEVTGACMRACVCVCVCMFLYHNQVMVVKLTSWYNLWVHSFC